ncbi:CBASS cGAMP-activated phospholipase [Luteolibacter sp. Populi]|uniref:CBASS cGAMP-activated phospholipase n=1 Tax=Luteolibacter sp. Populi TaxID=3230487 RepID=UPI0034675BD7
MDRFQILSLDGGGLKGLFSAAYLAQLERDAGRPCADMFDLICGTSTGGIIALGLGLGFPAEDIKRFYLEEAERIFPHKSFAAGKHWLATKYPVAGLNEALAQRFGSKLLGESRSRLLIPATDANRREVYIYKTSHHERLRTDYKVAVVDVARATSAAPTYFEAFEPEPGLNLVDGGVWANNPLMLGVAEALGYLQASQDAIFALRVGTTEEVARLDSYPEHGHGGKVQLVGPIMEVMMAVQSKSATSMAEHILGKGRRLISVNPFVNQGELALDKLTAHLQGLATTEYRKTSSDLHEKGFLKHSAAPFEPCHKLETILQ